MNQIFFILSFLLLVSCAAPQKEFLSDKTLEGDETILIMPFQNMCTIYGDKAPIDCVVFNRRHVVGEVPEGTAEFMTEQLVKLLMSEKVFRFVFPDQADEMLTHLQADKNGVVRMTELVETTGGTNGVDAILMGYIFYFRERVGTSYSVESPASVSFSLFLVRVKDGQLVWRGIFEETQQALSENILKIGAFIKRKARWITARELAAEGLENLISTFPEP